MRLHFWTLTTPAETKQEQIWQQAAGEKKAGFVWWGGAEVPPKHRRKGNINAELETATKTSPSNGTNWALSPQKEKTRKFSLLLIMMNQPTHFQGRTRWDITNIHFPFTSFYSNVNLSDMRLFMANKAIHDRIKNTISAAGLVPQVLSRSQGIIG